MRSSFLFFCLGVFLGFPFPEDRRLPFAMLFANHHFLTGPIASMFWLNEEYATGLADIVLDGVVCVVDAVFGQKVGYNDMLTPS